MPNGRDPVTVRLEPFPPKVPLHGFNKELVGMVFGTFLSTIVNFNVMLDGTDILDLLTEKGFQRGRIRRMRVPNRNESSQVFTLH